MLQVVLIFNDFIQYSAFIYLYTCINNLNITTTDKMIFCFFLYTVFWCFGPFFFHSVFVTLCFHLGVCTNGAFALCAGVGTELIKALGAHMLLVLLHIFLPVQVVTAVVAVKSISHGGSEIIPGTCGNTTDCQTPDLQSFYPPCITRCFL